jgi:hypothetical protein
VWLPGSGTPNRRRPSAFGLRTAPERTGAAGAARSSGAPVYPQWTDGAQGDAGADRRSPRHWLDRRTKIRPPTRFHYTRDVDNILIPHLGRYRLDDLNAQLLRTVFAQIASTTNTKGRPQSASTMQHLRTTLRTARHGGGTGRLRLWHHGHTLYCQVSDDGPDGNGDHHHRRDHSRDDCGRQRRTAAAHTRPPPLNLPAQQRPRYETGHRRRRRPPARSYTATHAAAQTRVRPVAVGP